MNAPPPAPPKEGNYSDGAGGVDGEGAEGDAERLLLFFLAYLAAAGVVGFEGELDDKVAVEAGHGATDVGAFGMDGAATVAGAELNCAAVTTDFVPDLIELRIALADESDKCFAHLLCFVNARGVRVLIDKHNLKILKKKALPVLRLSIIWD